jgi:hypothetical protein
MNHRQAGIAGATLGLALLVGSQVGAQERQTPEPGQRVRVTAPTVFLYPSVGILGALTGDSIVLLHVRVRSQYPTNLVDTLRASIALSAVRSVEVSRGKRSVVAPACVLGAVAGAVAGAAIADANYRDPCAGSGGIGGAACQLASTSKGEAGAAGALLGGALGALGGLLIAQALSTERWETVPLAGLKVEVARRPGGRLALGASLPF